MIPIGDTNTDRTLTPYINYLLIATNIFVFIYFQGIGSNNLFTLGFSVVPQEILTGHDIVNGILATTPIPVYGTLITAMFMHSGIGHLLGNMLYLWIFGDNLENRMGHIRYLLFYLLCGVIASLSHVFLTSFIGQDLLVPSLGASGAISGVLGGYLLLYPRNKIKVFAFFFVFRVPAFITLGLWIALQFWDGFNSLSIASGGGVAYGAHIGGFFAGLILVKYFGNRQLVDEQQVEYRK